MTTATEVTEKVQGGVLKAVETSQNWTLGAMKSTASAFDTMKPDAARLPFSDKLPTPGEAVDMTFGFWEKLLEAQHAFVSGMTEIYAPSTTKVTPVKKA